VTLVYTDYPNPQSCEPVREALFMLAVNKGTIVIDERTDATKLREDSHVTIHMRSEPDPLLREACSVLMKWGLADCVTPRPVSTWRLTELGWAVHRGQEHWPKEDRPEPAPAAPARRRDVKPVSDVAAGPSRYVAGPGRYHDSGEPSDDPESTMTVANFGSKGKV
jgi:hypothetical protein